MSRETEIGTQKLESSSETIELRFGQEPEIDTSVTELSDDELTLPILKLAKLQVRSNTLCL